MQKVEGLVLGGGLIFLGLALLRDKWKLSSRLITMQRSWLEMFGLSGDKLERRLDDQRIVARLGGGMLIAVGVYALALVCFAWR